MQARAFVLAGLALVAAFNVWLTIFTASLPTQTSLPWWGVAAIGSCAGLLIAWLRSGGERVGLLVALSANAVLRILFAGTGDLTEYRGLLEAALAIGLLVACYTLYVRNGAARGALIAIALTVGLFALRSVSLGQMEAALRQALHFTGYVFLCLAVRGTRQ